MHIFSAIADSPTGDQAAQVCVMPLTYMQVWYVRAGLVGGVSSPSFSETSPGCTDLEPLFQGCSVV